MSGVYEVTRNMVYGIPMQTEFYTNPLDPTSIYADSCCFIRDSRKDLHGFFGHSASKNSKQAVYVSQMEILERLYASKFAIRDYRDKHLEFINYINGSKLSLPASDYVLRTDNPYVGATGLAIHKKTDLAIKHAVLEILERHLLCEFWYYSRKLYRKSSTKELGKECTMIDFFVDNVPFSISVVYFRKNNTIFCGSSLKEDYKTALVSSRYEAKMLAANYFSKNLILTYGNKNSNIEKIKFLCSPTSSTTSDIFFSKISRRKIAPYTGKMEITDICTRIGIPPDSIYIAKINTIEDCSIYRATSKNALTKEMCRIKFRNREEDPFC